MNAHMNTHGGSGGRVEHQTVTRGGGGSIPPTDVSKLRQFNSPHTVCVSVKKLSVSRIKNVIPTTYQLFYYLFLTCNIISYYLSVLVLLRLILFIYIEKMY